MVTRFKILNRIKGFYHSNLIKVITGIRRCGKSVLLEQIIDELLKDNIQQNHIIKINFEDLEFSNLTEYTKLNTFILSKIKDKKMYYIFLDEIQIVKNWERVVNSLRATKNVSIFITGSNSKLLSGELATLLAGRYVSFKLTPLSFKEATILQSVKSINELDDAFKDYLVWGGMPQRFEFKNISYAKTYLQDIFNTIVLKDIVERHKIRNINLFKRIIEYIVTNPGQVFSAQNIVNTFKSIGINISKRSIYDILEFAETSFLITKASKYDLRGKRILTRNDKYYLTDLGLGQVVNTNKKMQLGAYLENIVFNELISRGYNVSVGNIKNKEIDFIASKPCKNPEYYQVYLSLANKEIMDREFSVFSEIKDNYPKYVLSLDKENYSCDGIKHMNVIAWLLGNE